MAIKWQKRETKKDKGDDEVRQKTDDEVPSWLRVSEIKRYFRELREEVNEEFEGEDRDTKNEEMEERFREDLVGSGDFIETMADALQKYSETERKRKLLTSDETSDLINDESKGYQPLCKSKLPIVSNSIDDSLEDNMLVHWSWGEYKISKF